MKVYIIEFKTVNDIISKAIQFVTRKKYTHTEIFFDNTNYGLVPFTKTNDYSKTKYKSIEDYLKNNPNKDRTVAFEVPYDFTKEQINKMHKWWEKRIISDKKYGYITLLSFLWRVPLRLFYREYYKHKKEPFDIKFMTCEDQCSISVDLTLKVGGYDLFPEFDERTTYPGLFAEKLKDYKIDS
jgi:hypothetical protein